MTITEQATRQAPKPRILQASLILDEATASAAVESVRYVLPTGSHGTRDGGREDIYFDLGGVLVTNDLVTDPMVVADYLRRIAEQIETATVDARQAQVDAEQNECWCGVRLEEGQEDCGARLCRGWTADDLAGRIP